LHQLCKLAWRPHACTMPAKAPQRPRLVQCAFEFRAGKVEPLLYKMEAKHPRRACRRTAVFALWIVWPDKSN
jgi:hypothetical protein